MSHTVFGVKGKVIINFRGEAHKHYAFDCVASGPGLKVVRYPIDVNVSGAISESQILHLGNDRHIVFATHALAKNGQVHVNIMPNPKVEYSTFLDFYGCQISPF